MIVVTGDTHGDFSRLSNKHIRDLIGEDDYVIIAGDCGLCWKNDDTFKYWLDFLKTRKFRTLFIDGNHENFDMLNSYKVDKWHGGKVHHIVKDKVIHLMRGQVFNIEDKKIFTFGGGTSIDIQGGLLDRNNPNFREQRARANELGLPYRVIGESWWEQEMPSNLELKECIVNLEAHNWQVDYIITHSICSKRLNDLNTVIRLTGKVGDKLTDFLNIIEERAIFKRWYFGHYHVDWNMDEKHCALYKQLLEVM